MPDHIQLYSASWFTFTGPGRIGISLGTPRSMPAGYRIYRELAPTRDMLKMPYEPYREKFFGEILGRLDPAEQFKKLQQLAGPDNVPVILCFEKPPFTASNWCHRTMVREWFEAHLGIETAEFEPSGDRYDTPS